MNFLKMEPFKSMNYRFGASRAKDMMKLIEPFLEKGETILDIGAGTCNISELLLQKNYAVTPLDVKNLSAVDHIKPIIYDGKTIPFGDDSFDAALILTVLHHTLKPEEILMEARRVSKKIIVIEDIYSSWLHKQATYFFDSLLNLEFIGHPHSNKTDLQWRAAFQKLGLKLKGVRYSHYFVFQHAVYYLQK